MQIGPGTAAAPQRFGDRLEYGVLGFLAHRAQAFDGPLAAESMFAVDGGIDAATVPVVVKAGAEVLVAGSAIFEAPDPARKVKELLEIASSVGYDRQLL